MKYERKKFAECPYFIEAYGMIHIRCSNGCSCHCIDNDALCKTIKERCNRDPYKCPIFDALSKMPEVGYAREPKYESNQIKATVLADDDYVETQKWMDNLPQFSKNPKYRKYKADNERIEFDNLVYRKMLDMGLSVRKLGELLGYSRYTIQAVLCHDYASNTLLRKIANYLCIEEYQHEPSRIDLNGKG